MKTPREVQLEKEYEVLERAYTELKDRYDQLCSKLKRNANDTRNEGDAFLSSYARDRAGPWS